MSSCIITAVDEAAVTPSEAEAAALAALGSEYDSESSALRMMPGEAGADTNSSGTANGTRAGGANGASGATLLQTSGVVANTPVPGKPTSSCSCADSVYGFCVACFMACCDFVRDRT